MYYPQNEREMQTILWDTKLSFLSQHSSFHKLVQGIFEQARDKKIFYPSEFVEPPFLMDVDPDLLEREAIRSAAFRVCGFGAAQFLRKCDTMYSARDRGQKSERAVRALNAATTILERKPMLRWKPEAGLEATIWSFFVECNVIQGRDEPFTEMNPQFDFVWLDELSSNIRLSWCQLHSHFINATRFNRFQIAAWLSTMAFATSARMDIIQILASFYNTSEIRHVDIPSYQSFILAEGIRPVHAELTEIVESNRRPFMDCPESRLPQHAGESQWTASNRRRTCLKLIRTAQ